LLEMDNFAQEFVEVHFGVDCITRAGK
jgi:hypothetical protein